MIFRIPTRFWLTETYELNGKVSLIPAGEFSQTLGPKTCFAGSFWYVERVPDDLTMLPLKNLKEFIRFWSFVFREDLAVTHFEVEEEHPCVKEYLPIKNTKVREGWNEPKFDPANIKLRIDLSFSPKTFQLSDLFSLFVEAEKHLKDLIGLYKIYPNKYVVNKFFCLDDNYLFKSSLNAVILDALTKEERCTFKMSCPKGCKNNDGMDEFQFSHPKTPFRQRINNLLCNFEDKDFYTDICLHFCTTIRNKVFHDAKSEKRPKTTMPVIDPITRMGRREATMEETLVSLRDEGLSADNAQIIFSEVIYSLLLNRLIPDLNFWPKLSMLKMVTNEITTIDDLSEVRGEG
ncbi:hypothetical protein JW899_03255 [Candidatus Uhrbacteria bacterium]|nr:hypothetical protein [Candidatus Uhrbacteria bacterium]